MTTNANSLDVFDGSLPFLDAPENITDTLLDDKEGDGRICKVYLLTNTINGKIYVGQTWLEYYQRMGNKNGVSYKNSIYLYNAMQKYGAKNFVYHTIKECTTQQEANFYEDKYIQSYGSYIHEIGYNIKNGGSNGKHTEETKDKIAKTLQEKEWSPAALAGKARGGSKWKGKKRGPQSEDRKDNVAGKMVEWHATHEHPFLGKHHTEEAKESMRQKLKGRKRDPESVKKGAESRRWDKEIIDNAIAAYQDGMGWGDIAKNFGIPTTTLGRYLKERKIAKRTEAK